MTRARDDRPVRIHPYVSTNRRKQLAAYCAEHDTTESAAVDAALGLLFGAESDVTLVMRRVDRLARAHERFQRDVDLFAETFAVFVQVWFTSTPALPPEARKVAQAAGRALYQQFVAFVAEQFAKGRRLLDDFPREILAPPEPTPSTPATDPSAPPTTTDPPRN